MKFIKKFILIIFIIIILLSLFYLYNFIKINNKAGENFNKIVSCNIDSNCTIHTKRTCVNKESELNWFKKNDNFNISWKLPLNETVDCRCVKNICTNVNFKNLQKIPDEVKGKVGYINLLKPNKNFYAATAWMQTIQDNKQENGIVILDWIKFYARVNGSDILLYENDFTNKKFCGGIYQRYPWFGTDISKKLNPEFKNGNVILKPYEDSNFVYHWWDCERSIVPDGTNFLWFESKIKISGGALVQVGIDFWKDQSIDYGGVEVNNNEAGISDWYSKNDSWQIIKFGKWN